MPASPDDVRFVINPSAGRGRSRKCLEGLREAVDALGGSLYVSKDAADLTRVARAAASDGVGRLVAAGGDGTFHHLIQGLAGTSCELGLIPLGRGNDLANTLGVPAGWREALEQALESPARAIDLGVVSRAESSLPGPAVCHSADFAASPRISPTSPSSTRLVSEADDWRDQTTSFPHGTPANGHYYALYCGVGFDSEAGRVANTQTIFKGALAYPYGVLRTLMGFEPPIFKIEYDDGSFEGPAMLVNVTNCNRMGGGMKLTPDAKPDDGRLDLALGHAMSRLTLLRLFAKIYRGTHVGHPAVTIEPTKSARIEVNRALEVNADGERLFVADGVLEIRVAPGALKVAAG